jgi:hypothetical protein
VGAGGRNIQQNELKTAILAPITIAKKYILFARNSIAQKSLLVG